MQHHKILFGDDNLLQSCGLLTIPVIQQKEYQLPTTYFNPQ